LDADGIMYDNGQADGRGGDDGLQTSVADTMELSGEKTVLDQHVVKLFSHKAGKAADNRDA
jgi:hypothetical protein